MVFRCGNDSFFLLIRWCSVVRVLLLMFVRFWCGYSV